MAKKLRISGVLCPVGCAADCSYASGEPSRRPLLVRCRVVNMSERGSDVILIISHFMACLPQLGSVPAAYAVVAGGCDWPLPPAVGLSNNDIIIALR